MVWQSILASDLIATTFTALHTSKGCFAVHEIPATVSLVPKPAARDQNAMVDIASILLILHTEFPAAAE